MEKLKRKKDWEGRYVTLNFDSENKGGGIFPAGTVMQVSRNFGGLWLRRPGSCDHCQSKGWRSINKVNESKVTLLPESYKP